MDPNDKEFMKQLGRDPFKQSGFDDRLRKRIEERIDMGQSRTRHSRKPVWRLSAAAVASVSLVILGVWLWSSLSGDGRSANPANELQIREAAPASSTPGSGQPKKFALLIGLREDKTDKGASWPTSNYRTLLVAPDNNTDQQRLIADNRSLYVPHQQNFFQIAAVPASGGRQALQAIQATNTKRRLVKDFKFPDNLLSERVLFAGNEYLSVSSTVKSKKGGQTDNYWVKSIDMINTKSDDPSTEPHVRLEGILPDKAANPPVEHWYVVRNPGRWLADLPGDSSAATDGNPFPAALPPAVVNRDSLTMSWDEILKIEPAARDAFTYGEMLGVVAGNEIRVFVVRNGKPLPNAVSIPLKPDESIVMIQWAQDGYVDKWIQEMRKISVKRP